MTLQERMELFLGDYGLSEAETQACMQFVMDAAVKENCFPENLYGTENCWEWDIEKYRPGEMIGFKEFVIEQSFKWSVNHFHALETTLQEIHRLSNRG